MRELWQSLVVYHKSCSHNWFWLPTILGMGLLIVFFLEGVTQCLLLFLTVASMPFHLTTGIILVL